MFTTPRPKFVGAISLYVVSLFGCGFFSSATDAADFRGAEAIIRQAQEAVEKAQVNTNDPSSQFRTDLKAFTANSKNLPSADAARQWLELYDRFATSELSMNAYRRTSGGLGPVQAQDLVLALPGPHAWAELAKSIEGRAGGEGAREIQELGLRLLAHTLIGDTGKRKDDVGKLEALAGKAKTEQVYFYRAVLERVWEADLNNVQNPETILKSLERKLAAQQAGESFGSLEIPNLVELVGPEKAEAFLRRALVKSEEPLEIEAGTETSALAAKLTLELIDEVKKPQWSLVNSLDSLKLYEALEKKFSHQSKSEPEAMVEEPASMALPALNFRSDDYRKTSAKVYYLLGLIAHDRTEDALKVAKEFGRESNSYFPTTAVREMERAGFTPQLNNFFREVLKQDPELPFWEEYVRLAAHAGKTAEMVELVRTTSESSSLSANQRLRLQALLHRALLADNKIEDGVAELRQLIQASAKVPYVESLSTELNTGALAVNLAEIGYLLNRTNWIEEGVAAAREAVPEEKERELIWGDSTTVSLAKLLTKLNRSAEAEAVLGSALERSLKSANAPRSFNSSSSTVQILGALVRLYHQSGRYSDVLYLFDNAANWGVKDLKDLPAGVLEDDDLPPHVTNRSAAKPIGYYAAAALAKTGRNDEARKILDATLNSSPGCDRLYELLLELEGDHALAKLDEIFARDQFEERPLIWKAHWLRMHDRLEDAEQAARKAIAIDPSDGEEGAGDRLRAYAELATIRAARGDQKEAAFLRGAVEAIRESERADQFYAAGLLLRAISMYEASLTHFADAYCIHARLAVQLSELGKHEEAAEHYRKAYELMPVSFGRVESHCFGCEQAFDGFRAQSVAERVFGERIQKTPNNPQVHYLFGYLREEQSRYGEAMEHYQAAVKLDADYLNAWLKIFKIGEQSRISSADRDEAVFNILRLDPRQRHGSVSFERVTDLKTLWEKVAEAHAKIPVKPLTLYPLSASKAELEKRLHLSAEAERSAYLNYQYTVASFAGTTPAAAIAQNKFIQAAQQMIDRSRSLGMEF